MKIIDSIHTQRSEENCKEISKQRFIQPPSLKKVWNAHLLRSSCTSSLCQFCNSLIRVLISSLWHTCFLPTYSQIYRLPCYQDINSKGGSVPHWKKSINTHCLCSPFYHSTLTDCFKGICKRSLIFTERKPTASFKIMIYPLAVLWQFQSKGVWKLLHRKNSGGKKTPNTKPPKTTNQPKPRNSGKENPTYFPIRIFLFDPFPKKSSGAGLFLTGLIGLESGGLN